MLRSVRLPDSILNLRLMIILILRHLFRRLRYHGFMNRGNSSHDPSFRWATLPPTPLRDPLA